MDRLKPLLQKPAWIGWLLVAWKLLSHLSTLDFALSKGGTMLMEAWKFAVQHDWIYFVSGLVWLAGLVLWPDIRTHLGNLKRLPPQEIEQKQETTQRVPRLQIHSATWWNEKRTSHQDVLSEVRNQVLGDGLVFRVGTFGSVQDPEDGDDNKFVEIDYTFNGWQRRTGTWKQRDFVVLPEDPRILAELQELRDALKGAQLILNPSPALLTLEDAELMPKVEYERCGVGIQATVLNRSGQILMVLSPVWENSTGEVECFSPAWFVMWHESRGFSAGREDSCIRLQPNEKFHCDFGVMRETAGVGIAKRLRSEGRTGCLRFAVKIGSELRIQRVPI